MSTPHQLPGPEALKGKQMSEIMFDRWGRAHISLLFDTFRPWQVFELIRRHWQEEADRLCEKGNALTSEITEATITIATCKLLSDSLKDIDDSETAEEEVKEATGVYDEIHAFLSEEVKRNPPDGKPKRYHRFSTNDSRCVYCGQMQINGRPKEQCEVLLIAAQTFAKAKGE